MGAEDGAAARGEQGAMEVRGGHLGSPGSIEDCASSVNRLSVHWTRF